MAEALRISFVMLKLIMLGVAGVFVLTCAYDLEENMVAVVLRFGAPARVHTQPGLKWKLPQPLEEVIKVPKPEVTQDLEIESFWYFRNEKQRLGLEDYTPGETLQLARDGYSLTASAGSGAWAEPNGLGRRPGPVDVPGADYSLVHTRWRLRYHVADAETFVKRLWDGRGSYEQRRSRAAVEDVLQGVVADAVIVTSARWDIQQLLLDRLAFKNEVRGRVAERLAALDVGLQAPLEGLELLEAIPPLQVKANYDAATGAGSEAARRVNKARAEASELLAKARAEADNRVAQARGRRNQVVEGARADAGYLGEVLGKIETAARERTPRDGADGEARYRRTFDELLAVTVDQLYQEALREVIGQADEVFVLSSPEGQAIQWRPILSRDATLKPRGAEQQPGGGPPGQPAPGR